MSNGAIDLKDLKKRMEGALTSLKAEFSGLRTGRAFVTVHADKLRFRKSIDVTAQHAPRVSRTRSQQLADQFYYPVEAGLAPDGPIVAIAAAYPSRLLRWGPVSLHWIWWLLLWSIAPAFVIRWLVNRWRPNTL